MPFPWQFSCSRQDAPVPQILRVSTVDPQEPISAPVAPPARFRQPLRSAAAVAILCVASVLAAGRGMTNEGAVTLDGDMPRYLMNGVYFLDVLRDEPWTRLIDYTRHYFARYPALSLGHHPLVPAVAQVPFHWLFGVSVFAGRAMIATFLMMAAVAWFALIRRRYGDATALMSALLLVTAPIIVGLSHSVLSEIPTLALIIVALYWLDRFCATESPRHAAAFVIAAVLSAYSKQFAVFMLPVYLAYFVWVKGFRRLLAADILYSCLAIIVLILPLVPLTMRMSRFNLAVVTEWAPDELAGESRLSRFLFYPNELWRSQVTVPLLILSIVSMVASAVRRDRRAMLFALWIALLYVQLTAIGWQDTRFSIYWIPAFCLFAASAPSVVAARWWRALMTAAVVLTVGYQGILAAGKKPAGAEGYEEAARYVVEHPKGDTVLYSASVDTGFFVLFVRKHDTARQTVVLRADKLLTTSQLMQLNLEDRIKRPEEIDRILREFGVGYVVIEETAYPAGPLEWLREETQSAAFTLQRRIPLRSTDPRLSGVSLGVYEYRDHQPADASAVLSMNIPLIGDSIAVPLRDLLARGKGRW
jgi:hypothetical protein